MISAFLAALLVAPAAQTLDANGVHTTYLWHLHQPIYWPDQRRDGVEDEYETAWESLEQQWAGASHPENDLGAIFGKPDRVAAYQWRLRDSIQSMLGQPEAGAHVQYSGALTENVAGLGGAGQLGYSSGWSGPLNQAQGWLTNGGTPRASFVNFAHHHALLPLQSERTQWLQIRLHQERMRQVWGLQPGQAKGFFPPETSFSERLIPVLAELGIEWSFVSNEHLSRACPDFPLTLGSGGTMTDPPNRADQLNPLGENWYSKSISRGCSPTNAVPFAYQPHRARHVDAATGEVSEVVVVPTAQAISWDEGAGPYGPGGIAPLQPFNDPARPMLVVMAHDGDNFFAGGYSYYQESVPNFVAQAPSAGLVPSTVDRYLQKYPVPADDVVKVEDGSWVNADSDFGSPQFTNWLWYPLAADGTIDPQNGWHNDAREYAIFTAAENRLRTAEALSGGALTTRIDHVLDPKFGTTAVERGWHYYLASMDSGNVYYGTTLDMEVKGTVGCNEAVEQVEPLLAGIGPAADAVEPTVFVPQRFPYNPGGVNFGAPHGYQAFVNDGSFVVWSFASDVSGIASATLRLRFDDDGHNPLGDHANELYAGGPGVGDWLDQPMQIRDFPAGNLYGWSGLEAYAVESPEYIAQHISAEVPAFNETLFDYYVEVVDLAGNVARTEIQHVWIGDGQGATPGGTSVEVAPDPILRGEPATITYDAGGGPLASSSNLHLHYGFNGWQPGTVQHDPMALGADGTWSITIAVPETASAVDLVFNDTSTGTGGTWDNNGGADWHFETVDPPPAGGLVATPAAVELEVVLGTPKVQTSLELESADGPFHPFGAATVPPDAATTGLLFAQAAGGFLPPSMGVLPQLFPTFASVTPPSGEVAGDVPTELTLTLRTRGLGLGVHESLLVATEPTGTPLEIPIRVTVIPPIPTETSVVPDPPQAGETVRIWYLDGGTSLAGTSPLFCHHGLNGWQPSTIETAAMTEAEPGAWYFDLDLPPGTFELDFVFTDGAGTWDNNAGQDWTVPVL